MKKCCEYSLQLWYKLWMIVIPVEGQAYILVNNQAVLENNSILDSNLKKNSHSITYHMIGEGANRGKCKASCVNSYDNEM